MVPDNYQQAWQAQASQTRVTVDADLLLKELQRNERAFRATIFFRDFREIVTALIMIPVWFYLGAKTSSPWTWYLTVPALLWIIGFFVVDRRRHPQKPSAPGEPLLATVKESLTHVEHQIWLLRNVFWWYLLPLTISIQTFFAHVAWRSANNWPEAIGALAFATPMFFFLAALYGFIDHVNQLAVRSHLGPRRQELLALSASLGDESAGEPATTTSEQDVESPRILRRWLIVAVSSFAIFAIFILASGPFADGKKTEPSTAPRVVEVSPEVLKSYEGVYAISPQFVLTVTLEKGKLMVQATGQQKFQVYPESKTKFFYKVVNAQLTFVTDENGKPERLILHQNGVDQVATRQDDP